MTLTGLWQADRNGLQRAFLDANSPATGKKSNAADHPSPREAKTEGAMQRFVCFNPSTRAVSPIGYRLQRRCLIIRVFPEFPFFSEKFPTEGSFHAAQ